jgi:hypothetical protein
MRPTARHMRTPAAFAAAALFAALIATSDATPAAAQENCWTATHGQFFNAMHYCVSSVLAPQGDNSYGPKNLARWDGDATKAWCEGVRGNGIGETITVRIEGAVPFRRLLIANGYPKSAQSYANNGRIKAVEITADTGFSAVFTLPDTSDPMPVALPALAQNWIRLKIVDVYPGERFADTCLSFVTPDFEYEEELLLREQGLLK